MGPILEQVALMKQADVIVLNEVDWGLKRTDYRNVAADLASALGMIVLEASRPDGAQHPAGGV